MAISARQQQRHLREFALIWTLLTVLMGGVTFFAIFATYGLVFPSTEGGNTLALPFVEPDLPVAPAEDGAAPTVRIASTLPSPGILTPEPGGLPFAIIGDLSQGTGANPDATPLPSEHERYDVGIQVQISYDNMDIWMNDVRNNLHMRWFKLQVRWDEIEPAPGQYDWTQLDIAIKEAADFDVKIMLSMVTTPHWAREPGVDLTRDGPPADPQDFIKFLVAMLERFPGQIHAIEVWNEQNLDREWTSTRGINAGDYVRLLQLSYFNIKARDRGIIVISGAPSTSGGWTQDGDITAIDDFAYLDAMLDAGMLDYTDCVGVHLNGYNLGPSVPYDRAGNDPTASFRGPFDNPHHSWSFYSTVQGYAQRIAMMGSDKKLCVTEFGWASSEGLQGNPDSHAFAFDNSLIEQRDWIVESLELMEDWGTVWLAFIWNLNYGPQAGWNPNNDNVIYSLIGPNWQHRPAYGAVGEWMKEFRERAGY